MMPKIVSAGRRVLILAAAVFVTLFAVRAWDSQRGPPLEPWHTYVPRELSAREIDAADWAQYLKAEDAVFESVRAEVTDQLPERDRVPVNRYFAASPIYPGSFKHDWNRSFVLEPAGPPAGAVVLLHGLTDCPYSLRRVAELFRDHGFVAIGIRLPGHGAVPGGLTEVEWEDWMAATRLAVKEARRRAGGGKPLEIVGYSNGGALALKYALDAIDDPGLARAERLILISPMIGITQFARFAGLAALPAYFPPFAKAAWLDISSRIQPVQIQLLSGQRGRAIAPADANRAGGTGGEGGRAQTRSPSPGSDLSVGSGLHGERAGNRVRTLRPPPGERQRACPLRRQPRGRRSANSCGYPPARSWDGSCRLGRAATAQPSSPTRTLVMATRSSGSSSRARLSTRRDPSASHTQTACIRCRISPCPFPSTMGSTGSTRTPGTISELSLATSPRGESATRSSSRSTPSSGFRPTRSIPISRDGSRREFRRGPLARVPRLERSGRGPGARLWQNRRKRSIVASDDRLGTDARRRRP